MSTTHDHQATAPSSEAVHRCIAWLAQRQLALPALLYLEAHAPLRFLAGQTLAAAAPVAGLLGFDALQSWADVLTDADAFAELRHAMDAAADQ